MRSWFRRRQPSRPPSLRRHAYRPTVEGLEDRTLLTAPVIDPIASVIVPAGKPLVVPVTASHTGTGSDQPLAYTASSSNPQFTVQVQRGNYLRLSVQGFGDLVFELFGDLDPNTVSQIAGLAKSGFYDGVIFHRIVNSPSPFVVQGGDPDGTGLGGPPRATPGITPQELDALRKAYQFSDEFNTSLLFTGTAQLAMANSGDDTNGSQFFITLSSPRNLDINHNIFGQLVRGQDVLARLQQVPTGANDRPVNPPVISKATVEQNLNDTVLIVRAAPGATGTANITVTAAAGAESSQRTFAAVATPDATNEPPFLNPIGDQVTPAGTPITFAVSGQDVEGDTLTFEAQQTDSPTTAGVAVVGNQITVTPNPGFTGAIHLKIAVRDAAHAAPFDADSQTIVIGVGGTALAPTATAPTTTEGVALTNVTVATFSHALTSLPTDFTAFISWGDGHETRGTVLPGGAAGSFTVTGSNTYTRAGTYAMRVKITHNPAGNTGIATATATVRDAPLTAQNGAALNAQANVALTNVTIATFTDANPNGQLGDYKATINWGDGTTTDATITLGTGNVRNVVGSHTYQASGNFNAVATISGFVPAGDVAGATAVMGSTQITVAPPAPPVPVNERFVRKLYNDLLGRAADEPSLTFLVGLMNQGRVTAPIMVQFFVTSAEYRQVRVAQLYRKLLKRDPDSSGLTAFTTFLAAGGRVEFVEKFILASPEFLQTQGRGTRDGFIDAAFQAEFGRAAEAPTRDNLRLAMSYPNVTRDVVAAILIFSDEYKAVRVRELFTKLLGRTAEDNAVVHFARIYASGVTDELVITMIAGSSEYLSKV